jgi:hypothetical protein
MRRVRPLILARLLLAAILLFGVEAAAEPIRISARGLDLQRLDSKVTRVGQLAFVAGFELSSGHTRFGGYSGLVVDEGGLRLVAVSDLGHWLVARLIRDEGGRLRGIGEAEIHPMLDRRGNPFVIKRAGDAEALEKTPDGTFLVAFEQVHRIARYRGPEPWKSKAEPVTAPEDLSRQASNGGTETMARLQDGRLLLFSETEQRPDDSLKGWLGDGRGGWAELGYRRRDGYRPVDAKVLPGGDLLVLERFFTLMGGFASRLVRIPAADIRAGAVLEGRMVAELASPLVTENFEGLAIEPAGDGGVFLFLVSDDNRVALQRTLLLQFRLMP